VLNGKVPDGDRTVMNEILSIFKRREASYDKLLIQTALVKEDDNWKNVFTKLVPLSKEYAVEDKVLDYGGFRVASIKADASDLCTIIEQLVREGRLQIKGCPEVLFDGNFAERKGTYIPSYDDVFELGWPANFYNFSPATGFQGRFPRDPLLVVEKPSFPDGSTAIKSIIEIDLTRRDAYIGHILILLPNYRAKIVELRIGPKESTIEVLPKEVAKQDIIGKLYCAREQETVIEDVLFSDERQVVHTGFVPHSLYFYLLNREDGELIDEREISFWWLGRPLPKDVTIEIAGEDVQQLITRGESDKVEFKTRVGKDRELDEFIESVVAFANSSGGVILVGIDDNANIVGITEEKLDDRVSKILRSHCDPPIQPEMSIHSLDDKRILMIQVKEGSNKPYMFRDKGIYVRAGATDRIATRAEVDEFYKKRA